MAKGSGFNLRRAGLDLICEFHICVDFWQLDLLGIRFTIGLPCSGSRFRQFSCSLRHTDNVQLDALKIGSP
jgi:hypothetical protein